MFLWCILEVIVCNIHYWDHLKHWMWIRKNHNSLVSSYLASSSNIYPKCTAFIKVSISFLHDHSSYIWSYILYWLNCIIAANCYSYSCDSLIIRYMSGLFRSLCKGLLLHSLLLFIISFYRELSCAFEKSCTDQIRNWGNSSREYEETFDSLPAQQTHK